MIFHINRLNFKPDVTSEEQRRGLDLLRHQGNAIPAVKAFAVGAEYGGEYQFGAVFQIEDLDGYWEYLIHPAHFESERSGLHLIQDFQSFDTTDSGDPDLGRKIAALHKRSYEQNPELAKLVADVPSFTAPDGTRPPSDASSPSH